MRSIKDIWSSLDFPSRLLAVEYQFGETEQLWACEMFSKKGEVTVDAYINPESLEGLKSSSLPVFVLISGKKVLSKHLKHNGEAELDELAARAFPGIDLQQLQFQVDELGEGQYIVSAIRNDILEELLEEFSKAGITILDVALGEHSLWSIVNRDDRGKRLGKYQINEAGDKLEVFEPEGSTVEIMGESLDPSYSGAFLHGLQSLALKTFQSNSEHLESTRENWKFGTLYKKGLLGAGIGFFGLLLINFLLFSHFGSANTDLEQQTQAYDLQFAEVKALQTSFEEKEEFLKINGGQNSNISQIGDELALLLPKQLSLSKMSFQPVTKVIKKENLVRFSRGQLLVEGVSDNYKGFQGWLDELHQLPWINEIEILGYQEVNTRHRADFAIKIYLVNG